MVVVVGAGAAGMLAAWRAASLGAQVLLLEKTERVGTKVLISGGGKCNITHDGEVEDLLRAFRPNEARFLRPSFYRFTNRALLALLTTQGLPVYTRPDGRVFPVDRTARDVVDILRGCLDASGVRTRLGAPVTGIEAVDGRAVGVRTGGQVVRARSVVLATGGSSYPATGTTGEGWAWAQALGHTIVPVRAALAPIHLQPPPPAWAGVALRDCVLRARQGGKEFVRWRGDLLFTHHGISGPVALGISREVAERRERGPVTLEADLLPDTPFESAAEQVIAWGRLHPRRLVQTFVEAAAPARLADALLAAARVDGGLAGGRLGRAERNRLVSVLKAWPLGEAARVPLDRGEVVAGGVALDEVDPHSMRSRVCGGLYLCGEVLDVAGPVGGYNLQAAFSTGYVAGEAAARGAAG